MSDTRELARLILGPGEMKDAVRFPPRDYETLRIDVSMNCNIWCSYCQVGRDKSRMDHDIATTFFRDSVRSVQDCVIGCRMEPTLYPRLTEFMAMIHRVKPPTREFMLQTNGTLLQRHDAGQMRDAGLKVLFLSIDSPNPETMRVLRDGTDLAQVWGNVEQLRRTIPDLDVRFSSVVSRGNITEIGDLIDFANQNGVSQVWLREVCYEPGPGVAPAPDMTLGLKTGEFAQLQQDLAVRVARRAPEVFFLTNNIIRDDIGSYADSLSHLRQVPLNVVPSATA